MDTLFCSEAHYAARVHHLLKLQSRQTDSAFVARSLDRQGSQIAICCSTSGADWIRCESRICPRCHHRRNRKKIRKTKKRIEKIRKVSENFYLLTASVADFDLIQSDIEAAVRTVAITNRRLWTLCLAPRRVLGAHFAITFAPTGKLHVHVVVHGAAPLEETCDFWRSEGLVPDESVTRAISPERVASYAHRAMLEWPSKEPGRDHHHEEHPHPVLAAYLLRRILEAPRRLRFSSPFGTFSGRRSLSCA